MQKRLEDTVVASDRLLKALITLLAVRDPSLLVELEIIFMRAAAEGDPIGQAMPGAWKEINRELRAIQAMAEEETDSETHIELH